jgi:thioesterase domain-containing protein
MITLDERIAALTPAQRQLLELRLKKQSLIADKKRILVPIQPDGSKRPFFCIHSAVGGVGYYANLARHLNADQPFYGVQALGLEAEQEPLTRVEEMASYYIEVIRTVQPTGPYLLGGHSSGGLVAFEMAQQLRRGGDDVKLLALLDTQLPARLNATADEFSRMMDDASLWARLTRAMGLMAGRDISVSVEELSSLGPEEQLNHVLDRLTRANALPIPQRAEHYPLSVRQLLLRRVLRVFNANYTAEQNYLPQTYPGRVTVIQVEDRAAAPTGRAARSPGASKWSEFSPEPVEVHTVPGNHVTVMTEPFVRDVAEKLNGCLEAVAGN